MGVSTRPEQLIYGAASGPQRAPSATLSRHPVSLAEAMQRQADRDAALLDWAAANAPLTISQSESK